MSVLMKIDFIESPVVNLEPTDFSSDKINPNPSRDFEDILKGQLREDRDIAKVEEKGNDKARETMPQDENRIREDEEARYEELNNNSKDDSINNKNDKKNDGEKTAIENESDQINDALKNQIQARKETPEIIIDEEIFEGKNAEITGSINLLLNILNELPGEKGNINDLKDVLKELQTTLKGDKSSLKDKSDILLKLRSLLKIFENKEFAYDGRSENNPGFSGLTSTLKEEIAHLMSAIEREGRKTNKGNIPREGLDSDLKEIKSITGDRVKNINETFNKSEENPQSGNKESHDNFQFSRNIANISRGSASSAGSLSSSLKNNIFNEQLQSIVQKARVFIKDNSNGSFSIRLYPESLGRINVSLGLDRGIISGRFLADNIEARDILLENINIIKDKLSEAGISVGEFHVNVREENRNWEQKNRRDGFGINHNKSMNISNEYDLISTYRHDGEIDLMI